MATYTNQEYADILFIYGYCNGNAAEARREYQRRFPNRRIPDARVFATTYRVIAETGSVRHRRVDAGAPRVYQVGAEEAILEHFEDQPTTSTAIVASQTGASRWKVWTTIHSMGSHPYHYTPVQGLEEADPERRVDFCRMILNEDAENRSFLTDILWTDESNFGREGITNFHNLHYWAEENPHLTRETRFQRKFSVNVWMGVIGRYLIGPHFFPERLNGEVYENFLRDDLPGLLDDVPLATRRRMIFQNDGCPAHHRLTVRRFLDERFPNRWIGRSGPINWPARSPDLTPLDFYVWGRMKELVYATPVNTREELMERINEAATHLRNNMTERTTRSEIRRRCRACIRNRGSHFEQD